MLEYDGNASRRLDSRANTDRTEDDGDELLRIGYDEQKLLASDNNPGMWSNSLESG